VLALVQVQSLTILFRSENGNRSPFSNGMDDGYKFLLTNRHVLIAKMNTKQHFMHWFSHA